MMWEGINQRRFPRVSYKCRIRVSSDSGEEIIDTLTENIGAGGICVVLDKAFALFEKVSVDVVMGEKNAPVTCSGSVVWVVKRHPAGPSNVAGGFKYDTGIEFSGLTAEDKRKISALVECILHAEA
jgi:Tfp pilus assembly protein PilZ